MKHILISGPCAQDIIQGTSYFGGAAGGIALNLAQENIPVGLLSVLGKDQFSKKYKRKLQSLHVNTEAVKEHLSILPVMTRLNKKNGEVSRQYEAHGVQEALATLQPDTAYLHQFDFLHVVNTPKVLAEYLAEHFSGTISYNPGSLFYRDHASLATKLLEKATYIFCNNEEFEMLQKQISFSKLFQNQLQQLFITNGKKGIVVKEKTKQLHFPAILVKNVVDTTGAGDAIVVGFLEKIANGYSWQVGIENGLTFASQIIQQHGVVLERKTI